MKESIFVCDSVRVRIDQAACGSICVRGPSLSACRVLPASLRPPLFFSTSLQTLRRLMADKSSHGRRKKFSDLLCLARR